MMFFFPDGQPAFDFLDDMPARRETGLTMRRGDADPHRRFANLQNSRAMHAEHMGAGVEAFGFGHDGIAFQSRHVVESFVFQLRYRSAEVMIAHASLEDHRRTGLGRGEPRRKGGGVDRSGGEFKHWGLFRLLVGACLQAIQHWVVQRAPKSPASRLLQVIALKDSCSASGHRRNENHASTGREGRSHLGVAFVDRNAQQRNGKSKRVLGL